MKTWNLEEDIYLKKSVLLIFKIQFIAVFLHNKKI